jgi:hypothetical protein
VILTYLLSQCRDRYEALASVVTQPKGRRHERWEWGGWLERAGRSGAVVSGERGGVGGWRGRGGVVVW